jgi:hypothetical protein
MAKIILEFDSVEDAEEARTALDGSNWKGVVWDLDQELRGTIKHGYIGNREATTEEIQAASDLRKKLREFIEDYNLNLDR